MEPNTSVVLVLVALALVSPVATGLAHYLVIPALPLFYSGPNSHVTHPWVRTPKCCEIVRPMACTSAMCSAAKGRAKMSEIFTQTPQTSEGQTFANYCHEYHRNNDYDAKLSNNI